MPRDEYEDDFEDVEEVDEFDEAEEAEEDDFEEVEEFDDDVEEAELVDEVAEAEDKGRRQLQRGAASRFSDRLTGGASRPGEEDVKRSPFVVAMTVAVVCLALAAIVFGVLIINEGEKRAFGAAEAKLKEENFAEAESRFTSFLEVYPEGEYVEQAKVNLYTSKVMQYFKSTSMTVDETGQAVESLETFIKRCRDLPAFAEEKENLKRWSQQITRACAVVAKERHSSEALENSEVAEKILMLYSKPEGVSLAVENELTNRQREAERAIIKHNSLSRYLKEIDGYLKANNTFDALGTRQALLDEYPVMEDDAELARVLESILDVEKTQTVTEDVGRNANTEDLPSAGRSGLSLTLRTQKSVDQVSQGRVAFTLGIDSCFGVDTETGEPVWKRSVGVNAAFAPVPVQAATPGVLVYHTDIGELMLLNQKDGSLIWRQPVPARPSAPPFVNEQQVYITTSENELLKISLDSGRLNTRVKFNQPVVGPPTLTRDQKYMVIAGDQSVVYSLDALNLQIAAVSYVEHRPGSVEAPIQTMGKIMLLCDNNLTDEARLRVLAVDGSGKLSKRYETSVPGHVRDRCILRGTNLFVPSTPQRVTAFNVNDDPEANPPISPIGGNQLEDSQAASVFLMEGPNNRLWMATNTFRKFQVRSNAVELLPEELSNGLHLLRPSFADQAAYTTTVEPYSSSVFFTRVDPSRMQGEWRTVVGTNVVAAGPSANNNQVLLVGDFGSVFRVPLPTLKTDSFYVESISSFQIPDKLSSPVGGIALKDGRVAAYCGGETPAAWTFTNTGQLESRWDLPAAPELPPVALGDGIVFATSGRIHMTAVSSTRVADYRSAQRANDAATWKSLTAVNERQVLAVSAANEAVLLEYRTTPRPSLVEISRGALPAQIDLKPTAAGDLLMAVSTEGELLALSSSDNQLLKKVPLGGLPTQPVIVAGDLVFADVRRSVMKVFRRSAALEQVAEYPLNGNSMVGTPVAVRGGVIACFANGDVVRLDESGQPTDAKISIGQSVSSGPVQVGNSLVVTSVDGTLYLVDELLNP